MMKQMLMERKVERYSLMMEEGDKIRRQHSIKTLESAIDVLDEHSKHELSKCHQPEFAIC
jgi:hypothetical protein